MFNTRAIFDRLSAIVMARGGRLRERSSSLLMTPSSYGWPIFVTVSGDEATVRTGSGTIMTIDDEVPSNDNAVVEVVAAIVDGQAEEYVRFVAETGTFEICGHRVWYGPHDARESLDEGVVPDAVLRAYAWE